ncbi:MAG: bestrophin family protein [Planctomycetota bacterium]
MIPYEPKQWWRVLFDFQRSPVFRTLILDVLIAGAWAALVVWIETDVFDFAVPLGPAFLSILGIILGLLLVFRTNTAYDRWWEGRKIWGALVNVSRGLAHQLDAQLVHSAPERREAYAEHLAEFPVLLKEHLRKPRDYHGEHEPNRLLTMLHRDVQQDIQAGNLDDAARITLQPLLQAFDDVLGKCERIRKTPIPFSYSSYVKQFVVLYALMVPFALVKDFGYGAVIASMFSFFATMGLELLANEIEEPFGTDPNDLPLTAIGETIARDVRQILSAPLA